MHILIISPDMYPCVTGGVEVFNGSLAKGLRNRGHKVTILTCCDRYLEEGVSVVILDDWLLIRRVMSICLSIFINLLRLHKHADAVYVPYVSNSYIAYPVLAASLILRLRYVVVVHGGGLWPWKHTILQSFFFKGASSIIAVSSPIKEEYEKRTKKTIKLIPPLIPFKRCDSTKEVLRTKYGFSLDDQVILCLGSVKQIKGSDILLEAFQRLGIGFIKNYRVHLIYAGDGPLKDLLEKKAMDAGLKDNLHFFGAVSRDRVPELYALSDLYVIPSLLEGTPVSLLEAVYNGLPVIGSDIDGISQAVKGYQNARLFRKGDVDDLCAKLKDFLDLPCEPPYQAVAVDDILLDRYDYEKMVSKYINVFKEAAGEAV